MPELPEVETLRRDVDREVVGKRVKTVEVPGKGVIVHHPNRRAFVERLEGVKFTGVERKGTVLVLKMDNAELFVMDLRDGGLLRRATAKDELAKDTQVIITFTQTGQLRFLDSSGGLKLWVATPEELAEQAPELFDLGMDPVDEAIAWTSFARLLLGRKQKVRALLMDRSAVAGIGPMYADEILHNAGLRYDRQSEALSAQEMRRLYRALVETLHDAVKHRGTSPDDGFTDIFGKPGDYQLELKVFGRDGQACKRCRGVVAKGRVGGKPVWFCPDCQV
jgi:formamidopyrimidine-DNA glycosylase